MTDKIKKLDEAVLLIKEVWDETENFEHLRELGKVVYLLNEMKAILRHGEETDDAGNIV